MKVLNVNHILDPVHGGGTAERTSQLNRCLAALGCRSRILAIGDPAVLAGLNAGRVDLLPYLIRRYHVPWPDLSRIRRLVSWSDVVHLSGHWSIVNILVFLGCLLERRPYIVCPAGALTVIGRSRILKRIYDLLIGRLMIRRALCGIAISDDERSDFRRCGQSRVVRIPNGISEDVIAACAPLSRPDEHERQGRRAYALFLGRLAYVKGPDLMIEAFSRIAAAHPGIDLVMAGPDGGMLEQLRAATQQGGIASRIRFAGAVRGAEKQELIRNATMMVIPSRSEAMSIVVLEAGVMGVPVVFTDRCGLDELADAGAGSRAHVDAASIAAAMATLLSSPDSARRSGALLRDIVVHRYSWKAQAEKYRRVFAAILGTGQRNRGA